MGVYLYVDLNIWVCWCNLSSIPRLINLCECAIYCVFGLTGIDFFFEWLYLHYILSFFAFFVVCGVAIFLHGCGCVCSSACVDLAQYCCFAVCVCVCA